jgi:protein required for attachment to host cells
VLRFACEVADQLGTNYTGRQFQQHCLIAPPTFFGLLRQALALPLRGAVVCARHKDLTQAAVIPLPGLRDGDHNTLNESWIR